MSMAFKMRNLAYHVNFIQNQNKAHSLSQADLRIGLNQNKRPYQNEFPFVEKKILHFYFN